MAGVVPKSLQIPSPSLPSTLNSSPLSTRRRKALPLAPHALADDPKPDQDSSSSSSAAAAAPAEPPAPAAADPTFENRLARVRLKYRSGTGKKAEQRRARKSGGEGGGSGKKKVMLPPVPLKEAVAAGGLAVELGFSPYSERLNGRLAGLGLAALLLVELGSGQSLLRYHSLPILFIQLYSIAAAAAIFIKFEKERISIWPPKPPPPPPSSSATAAD
ncbi:uncharacterized protein LOC103710101 [Phoenix dactylifera]|uniref:Uncharacterized protein LOC103710101 n=1 Tax=Phoenix dactylifera TaxID=42345 RepID=A0A8B7C8G6_PHODC|nr:uncharacterized protein LOC103710101 [Phoenix dactylifera]